MQITHENSNMEKTIQRVMAILRIELNRDINIFKKQSSLFSRRSDEIDGTTYRTLDANLLKIIESELFQILNKIMLTETQSQIFNDIWATEKSGKEFCEKIAGTCPPYSIFYFNSPSARSKNDAKITGLCAIFFDAFVFLNENHCPAFQLSGKGGLRNKTPIAQKLKDNFPERAKKILLLFCTKLVDFANNNQIKSLVKELNLETQSIGQLREHRSCFFFFGPTLSYTRYSKYLAVDAYKQKALQKLIKASTQMEVPLDPCALIAQDFGYQDIKNLISAASIRL